MPLQRLARAKVRADLGTPLLSQALSVNLLHRLAEAAGGLEDVFLSLTGETRP